MTYTNAPDPRLAAASTCPRCGGAALAGADGWSTCRCGRSWPVHPAETTAQSPAPMPADTTAQSPAPMPAEVGDDLGAAALTPDRLRAVLHGPVTAAEGARRRLDRQADR